ncbi:hypothetical protein M011DRAFT_455018 [Sporormia fimetaria CBS 119925]|uniref:EF-hand domain-containing protein n=1 Tax=Sporormia fimetaria CBS 119925 TaxID=1340428 RepID=A0A6A6VPT5_9PLEO|nr:hypothetical protein M011DRAFT_455018 [Sporormia fimetaria CBS 119925]
MNHTGLHITPHKMSSTPNPYKPSPLSFNSPRTSPFRRQNSPAAQSSPAPRPLTPSSSPLKPTAAGTPSISPLKPAAGTPSTSPPKPTAATPSSSPLKPVSPPPHSLPYSPLGNVVSKDTPSPPPWLTKRDSSTSTAPEAPRSPTRQISESSAHTVRPLSTSNIAARFETAASTKKSPPPMDRPTPSPAPRPAARPAAVVRTTSTDALSKLPPPLLHSMRESFSVLDRDDDGHVDASDVADMLSQLGLTATPATLSSYFNGAQSINLATYLNTLSDLLSALSHPSELTAALEAFDDGDDGQIDLAELKDALLHTAPEEGERRLTEREIDMVVDGFSGRRAFSKGGKGLGRGEVFRYQEFVASLTGGGGGQDGAEAVSQA